MEGLHALYPCLPPAHASDGAVSAEEALALISHIAAHENIPLAGEIHALAEEIHARCGFGKLNMHEPVRRGAFAAWIDELLDPFGRKSIDLHGNFQ
jgi:hypothetical protein